MAKKKTTSRAKRKPTTRAKVVKTVTRELKQLRASVKGLTKRLVQEAKRRQMDAKLMAAARQARQAINRQVVKLSGEGRKLAGELKTALAKVKRHEGASRDAQSQVKTLNAELRRKEQELARKNAEIERLSGELARRSAPSESPAPSAAEPAHQSPLFPSEPSGWPPSSGGGED